MLRENIKTIKFTAVACTIFAIFTYIVTLNMELHFIKFNSPWLPNNFTLTICGGVFASFFVVFLCEIQKYRSNKTNCENFMFSQAISMYGILHGMNNSIKAYLEREDADVPDNLLDQSVQMVLQYMSAIEHTDYVTFLKKDELVKNHQKFCAGYRTELLNIERSTFSLKIAIKTAQMEHMRQQSCLCGVKSKEISDTLTTILKQQEQFLQVVVWYLKTIDDACKKRFNWTEQKEKIDNDKRSVFDF